MSNVLAVSHRPKKLSQLVGQAVTVKAIRELGRSGRHVPAWLFAGPPGTGKTTLARIVALAVNCSCEGEFGELSDECWHDFRRYEIHELDGASANKIEDVRPLADAARYKPLPPTKHRVYILDEAQRLTAAAQQVLLKPCEDGNDTTVWILCTTEPEKISEALRRRCIRFDTKLLSDKGREALLSRVADAEGIKGLEAFKEAASAAEIRSPGWLLNGLQKFIAGSPAKDAVKQELSEKEVFPLVQAMAKGNWQVLSTGLRSLTIDVESARKLRAISLRYLQTMLLGQKGLGTVDAKACLSAIEDLGSTSASFDDSMLATLVVGAMARACDLFAKKGGSF